MCSALRLRRPGRNLDLLGWRRSEERRAVHVSVDRDPQVPPDPGDVARGVRVRQRGYPERDGALVEGGGGLWRAVVLERRADERVVPAGAARDIHDEPLDVVLLESRWRVAIDHERDPVEHALDVPAVGVTVQGFARIGVRGAERELDVGNQVRQHAHLVRDGAERSPPDEQPANVAHLPVDGDCGKPALAVRELEMDLLALVPGRFEHAAEQVLLEMLEDFTQRRRRYFKCVPDHPGARGVRPRLRQGRGPEEEHDEAGGLRASRHARILAAVIRLDNAQRRVLTGQASRAGPFPFYSGTTGGPASAGAVAVSRTAGWAARASRRARRFSSTHDPTIIASSIRK